MSYMKEIYTAASEIDNTSITERAHLALTLSREWGISMAPIYKVLREMNEVDLASE